jgi:membrane protease YdiL (CAAX protease family)
MPAKARLVPQRRGPPHAGRRAASYWEGTREPLAILAFLFPLVLVYEVGALLLRPDAWPEQRLVAQKLIQHLGAWLGADATWVPGAALIVTLVVWQSRRRGPWRLRVFIPLAMIAESLLLTVPLFVLGRILQQATSAAAGDGGAESLLLLTVLALGAGVYEELVFRFYLINGLKWLFRHVGRIPPRAATVTAAVLAALVFAVCHFEPIASEAFAWPQFLVRFAAGGYLSIIFVLRGLGVSTGCHAAFNLITVVASYR